MSKLIHKTREGSSTYGKPRVFMSFYKTDLDGPVSELCEDILRINNCAVYMYDDGVIPAGAETREAELGQMQLFVLVCTSDYMSKQNTSRDREILFALAHGIPVLPVIPGESVIDSFNALCAGLGIESLHCLDRNEFTGNDEGYRGKLREHLDYFLISDEDSVRMTGSGSAFDQAYFVWDKLTREHPENETYAQRLALLKNLM